MVGYQSLLKDGFWGGVPSSRILTRHYSTTNRLGHRLTVHNSRILIVTGLAGRLLAVGGETLLDVLHDLQLQLLSEVELSKYLLLPPNWSGPLLIVELVLKSSRLESLDPHVVQPDNLDRLCPLQLNDLVIHLLHLVCPAISNSARQIFLCSDYPRGLHGTVH